MERLTELFTLKILEHKEMCRNTSLTEYILDNHDDADQIKNVCAKLHVDLVDRIDNTIALLGISKRLFIETAVIAALQEFDRLATDLDVDEYSRYTEEAMQQESSK